MLPRAFPPTSSETYNVFTKNSNLVLASPFYINGEALSPLLLLRSGSFHKCAMRGLRFYSEMTLGSSNFRLDLQAAVAVQILLEVTETQKAQFYHSMKAFKSRFHEGRCLEDSFNTYLAATLYRPYLKQRLFKKINKDDFHCMGVSWLVRLLFGFQQMKNIEQCRNSVKNF